MFQLLALPMMLLGEAEPLFGSESCLAIGPDFQMVQAEPFEPTAALQTQIERFLDPRNDESEAWFVTEDDTVVYCKMGRDKVTVMLFKFESERWKVVGLINTTI